PRTPRRSLALQEAADRRLSLLAEHRQRQPVTRVADGVVPREVPPPVELLLRVAGRLRELAGELLHPLVDDGVELARRNRTVHEPPFHRLRRRDLVTEKDDLARSAVADEDREPLRRAARRHRAVLEADRALVVPGGVLARARDLPEHPEVERVQHLWPVERDRRPRRRLLVDDRLEAELLGRARPRMRRLSQPLRRRP